MIGLTLAWLPRYLQGSPIVQTLCNAVDLSISNIDMRTIMLWRKVDRLEERVWRPLFRSRFATRPRRL